MVTARRRDEALVTVPIAITRVDGAIIDALQYRDLAQVLALSPGALVYKGGDGISTQLMIRGVVTPGEFTEPGNAVYVDEIYASGMRNVLPGFYDIESVQVLKGPQAGLYGRNTTGGAVLVTTRQPTDALSARINASQARFDATSMDGTLNVPLSDTLRLRATGWDNDRDGGYYRNDVLEQELDASRDTGARLTLAVLPQDHIRFVLSMEYADLERSGFKGAVRGAQFGPAPLASESRRNVLRDDPLAFDVEATRLGGKLDIDTHAGTFTAVAGWRRIEARDPGSDSDGTAWAASYAEYLRDPSQPLETLSPMLFTRDDQDESLSVDLRFATPADRALLRTLVGLSYFGETIHFADETAPARGLALILRDIGQDGSFARHADQDTASWAGFAELLWTPREAIEITTDLRYTKDRKDFEFAQTATGLYSLLGLTGAALDTDATFDNWSPGITLAWKPTDALMLYGKYVHGFRAGGFNTLVNDPALLPYESEESENLELGLKVSMFERRLDASLSVFRLRIDNALVPVIDPGVLATFFPLQNPGEVETTGLELDLVGRLLAGLSISASAGAYDFSLENGGPVGRDRRPFVPEYTASLTLDYQLSLSAGLTGLARLGYHHRNGGRVFAPYELAMDAYHLLDAEIGLRLGKLELAGFVRNALDDHYEVSNLGIEFQQARYASASGLDPATTRAIVLDSGTVLGVRLSLQL